jgi:4-amino-4-deoxy-L-arabinose transferase-like glycosyltransferase
LLLITERKKVLPGTKLKISRRQWRTMCRVVLLALVIYRLWVVRYVVDADGIAYLDVARAWLRGDWIHALNPYWSPLYIWLLAVAFGLFDPSVHWQIPLMHAVALLGFMVSWAAWEWLSAEWEHWQGPPVHPLLIDTIGYCVLVWAGIHLTGLGRFNNADVFVMGLLLAAGALLVRVRRGAAAARDFVLLGFVLGTGFLAKTAVIIAIPMFLAALALLLHSWRDWRLSFAALATLAVMVPFVLAISLAQGRFTFGDSGRLNYSWHVTGMSVEGYKENAYWPGFAATHPIRVLMQHPRVLSYEQHLVGTLPIHTEPSWWCAGYPVRFDKARQLMILWSDIKFSILAFRCPALFLILFGLFAGALVVMAKQFAQVWFLWGPALLFALSYCPVYSDYRYLAASYALIGFALIAAAWQVKLPRSIALVSIIAVPVLTALFMMGSEFRHMPRQFVGDVLGRREPWDSFNIKVAENMQKQGLRPGDLVAYIGFSLGSAHVGLEQAHIVATVPERTSHDDTLPGRPYMFTFQKPDEFWRSSPAVQQQVLDAFRSVGAKWVFADCVPNWADTTGWQVAGESRVFRGGDRPYTYFRKLE